VADLRHAGALVLAAACAALGGCTTRFIAPVTIASSGPGPSEPESGPPGLEVRNDRGSVRVLVDPRATQTTVTRSIRPLEGADWKDKLRVVEAVPISAESVDLEGHRVLRVTGGSPTDPTIGTSVDLTIVMPACRGVRIQNSGGPVEVVNAAGPFVIENGGPRAGYGGGSISVRTGERVIEPVTLTSSDGDVYFQTVVDATGQVELSSDDGKTGFVCPGGQVADVTAATSSWRGRVNGGENPIRLHTGRGDARVLLIENSGTYANQR
jgi:hypothetical protein